MRLSICIVLFGAVFNGCSSSSYASRAINNAQIENAIDRDICYSVFWGKVEYRLGAKLTFTVVDKHDHLEGWTDGLVNSNVGFITKFIIRRYKNILYVDSTTSYNKAVFPHERPPVSYRNSASIITPTNCKPDLVTGRKKLGLIYNVLRLEFKDLGKVNSYYRSSIVPLIVANVDERYPKSIAYVPQTGDMFIISCRPGVDRPTDCSFGQEYNKRYIRGLVPKLFRFGRQITIKLAQV